MRVWKWLGGLRLATMLVSVALIVVAAVVWDSTRSVEKLLTENRALHEALARLEEESIVAYGWLLAEPAPGERQMAWLEVPALGEHSARFRSLGLRGREVFFEALVIKVPPSMVADGTGRSLLLWRRAFGSAESADGGWTLSEPGTVPLRYAGLFDGLLPKVEEERFWSAMWDLAHDPEALAAVGIEAIYGNTVSVAPRAGAFYTLSFSATGGLSLATSPMAEAPGFLGPR